MRAPVLRVHDHPRGPWLVRRGARQAGVEPALGRGLATWDGARLAPDLLRAACAAAARRAGRERRAGDRLAATLLADEDRVRRGPRWRRRLLAAAHVARLARPLVPLTHGAALAAGALAGAALLAAALAAGAPRTPGATPGELAAALALFLATAMLHELGHAAALLRAGYPPGPVGVGLLFVWPVLWCDVTPVALLGRRDRLRVDLAGPALQLAAAGLLAGAGRLAGAAAPALAAAAALTGVAWSLLPFVRADGFWCLCDLVGHGDLDRPPRPADTLRAVRARRAYRLLHSGFLLVVAAILSLRLSALGAGGRAVAGALAVGAAVVILRRHKAGARSAGPR